MSKRILVLDDDEYLLELMDYLLTDNGYTTSALSKGDLLMENMAAFHPDLLLMDVMLAGMDGRKLCQEIKANELYNWTPVILISASHLLDQVMNQPGAPNDFITKPFDIDDLLRRVKFQLS